MNFQLDELKYIVCGEDFKINDNIILHNPTIREVLEIDERIYLILINQIVMRPYDDMVFLDDHGINYLDVTDFEIFMRNIVHLPMDKTKIIFGENLDFTTFKLAVNRETERPVITDGKIIIDELIYEQIVTFIRGINFINPEEEYIPGNETFRKYLIEKKRKEMKRASKRPFETRLGNLISFIVNHEGSNYNYETVKDLKISQLYDSYYRINKIQNYKQSMSGVYAGTVKYADLDKEQLNWAGKITR